jgi:hypothetical protein
MARPMPPKVLANSTLANGMSFRIKLRTVQGSWRAGCGKHGGDGRRAAFFTNVFIGTFPPGRTLPAVSGARH